MWIKLLALCFCFMLSLGFGAVDLDGTDDLIDLDSHVANFMTSSGAVSCWYRGTADASESALSVAKDTNYWFNICLGDGVSGNLTNELIMLSLNANAGSPINRVGYTTATRTELFDGAWHHIVFQSTGSAYEIYLDGSSKTVTVGLGNDDGAWADTAIGSTYCDIGVLERSDGSYYWCDGEITEVAIWDTALTAPQIAQLYDSRIKGLPLQIAPANLKGYWPLDDHPVGTNLHGTVFKDASGNGNDGTGSDAGSSGGQCQGETVLSYPPKPIGGL